MNQQKKKLMQELQEYYKNGYKYVVKAKNIMLSSKEISHNDFFPCKNEKQRDVIIKELSMNTNFKYIEDYPIYAWGCIENTFRRSKNCSINTTFID